MEFLAYETLHFALLFLIDSNLTPNAFFESTTRRERLRIYSKAVEKPAPVGFAAIFIHLHLLKGESLQSKCYAFYAAVVFSTSAMVQALKPGCKEAR